MVKISVVYLPTSSSYSNILVLQQAESEEYHDSMLQPDSGYLLNIDECHKHYRIHMSEWLFHVDLTYWLHIFVVPLEFILS